MEGNAMPDHIHMLLSIPPKYSVVFTVAQHNIEVEWPTVASRHSPKDRLRDPLITPEREEQGRFCGKLGTRVFRARLAIPCGLDTIAPLWYNLIKQINMARHGRSHAPVPGAADKESPRLLFGDGQHDHGG